MLFIKFAAIMITGTLSQLDEEQLRLETELESVRRELEAYNNTNPVAINARTSSSHHRIDQPPRLYHPLQHRHSDDSLNNTDYLPKNTLPKEREPTDHNYGMGGENPFYGAHMMQMLLEQQAKIYSKENEMLRKEMEQLKVSNYVY